VKDNLANDIKQNERSQYIAPT